MLASNVCDNPLLLWEIFYFRSDITFNVIFMQTKNNTFVPDPCQTEVIEAEGGFHLVLAPPGCGKTQILTERIRHAHDKQSVAYGDMLCLTFTNRAARGMAERISESIADSSVSDVFVGNVHRFCSKFLYSNGIISAESSVIDEDDAVSILARYIGDDEYKVQADYNLRRSYSDVFNLESLMHQIAQGYPRELRIHPECLSKDDITAMDKLCRLQNRVFDAAAMIDIYEHSDTWRDLLISDTCDYGDRQTALRMLQKMGLAWQYHQYKLTNRLLDFHDLLLLTYDALAADAGQKQYKRYTWVQVDEVQDLNQLQMAIIKLLTARPFLTVMFLGDEQQAIFSFMGAKLDTLSALKEKPQCQLHHLSVNHRSPKYLLNILNTYAADLLHIDRSLLPEAGKNDGERTIGNELQILCSETYEQEVRDCVQFTDMLRHSFPDSTTAIVVNANHDAEVISSELARRDIGHFKVSGTDLFSSPDMKLLLAHLSVLGNEFNFMAWARLMKGVGGYESNAAARNFVRQLFNHAILPSDLLHFDGSSYLQHFADCYENETLVVFDTETTGLNVFEDDILQIAAVKMRKGEVVEGSNFTVYIESDRKIPEMLGDIVNPIIEERKKHRLLAHEEALRLFMNYAEGCVLLGHNADYDYHILDFNLRRYAPEIVLKSNHASYLDSLRLVRLLHPELKEHKLKYLLAVLGLEGCNSHLADDDVDATRSVVNHCYALAVEKLDEQRKFLSDSRVRMRAQVLRRNYGEYYVGGLAHLYDRELAPNAEHPALVEEITGFYEHLLAEGMVMKIEGLRFVTTFLTHDIIDATHEPSLYEQLCNHSMEICTLKEADLCGSGCIDERVFVTTIHKAKGLEFDNVIVFDAVDGRIPNFYSRNSPKQLAEDARKFYVALSRAKRRLYVSQCIRRYDYHNMPHDVHLTPFMKPIAKFFKMEMFCEEENMKEDGKG